MTWKLATSLTFLAGVVAVAMLVWKRAVNDPGSVSEQWLAEHRADVP